MPVFVDNLPARSASVEQASRDGNLFRAFFQGSVPDSTTYYFVLDIPEGVSLIGFSRFIEVEEGSIRSRFGVGTGFGAIQETYDAHNFKVAGGQASRAQMRRVTGPVDLEFHSPDRLLAAPTTGPTRIPSNQTDVGAQVTMDSEHLPFFTITNLSTTQARECTLFLAWQELVKGAYS
jgi:hypothetical protein